MINWHCIEALNDIQENLTFSLANKLKKKHVLWTEHKINVSLAAQTLSSSVATAIDVLCVEANLSEFQGSEATTYFIKMVDMAFDLMNIRHPLVTGYKSPVTKSKLSNLLYQCNKIVSYFFELKDECGHFLRVKYCKTVIWGFVLVIHSVMAITQDMLTHLDCPLKYVLTYKFSQDHIELLFNKIRLRGEEWNNNPNVLQLKYVVKSTLIRNSIEPSNTGNCTHFQDSLCESNGLLNFTTKRIQYKEVSIEIVQDSDLASCECMLIELDQESPNELLDNVLYYILGLLYDPC